MSSDSRSRGLEVGPATGARPVHTAALELVLGLFLCVGVAMDSVLAPRPEQLIHAAWFGVTAQDLVFPLFVVLSGVGLAFAHRGGLGWATTVRRGAVLLACGLVFNAVVARTLDLATLRWTGELQVYAVLVLTVGLLHKVARGPRAWVAITGLAALLQGAFLLLWQSGCPDGAFTPGCNPSRVVDPALFGRAHVYIGGALGHDPEGVVALLGALVTVSAGVAAGHLALTLESSPGDSQGDGRRHGRHGRRVSAYLLGWAATVTVAAVAAGQWMPAMKRLWTTPLGLGAAALGVALFAVGLAALHLRLPSRLDQLREALAWPFVAMGRNALLVYFGSQLLMLVLLTRRDEHQHPLANVVGDWVEDFALGHNRTGLVAVMLGLWLLVAAVLRSRRIYLRA